MVDFLNTPAPYIALGLVIYLIAYVVYSKYIDKRVWNTDPNKPTPAKLYTDGVEYFPVSKYVLYGYQFKSVAALGPIVGPIVAVYFYGWLPALIWLILGNFFIGWVQDYSAMMMSVRNDGRSMGPITYNLMGERVRKILLVYIMIYLIIITAVFAWVIVDIINRIAGSFIPIIFILFMGALFGQLVFRMKIDILIATIIAIAVVFLGIVLVGALPQIRVPPFNFLDPGLVETGTTWPGSWTVLFWLIILAIIYYLAAITPMPRFLLPTIFVGFLPAIIALILVIIAALFTPLTGITINQIPVKDLWITDPNKFQTGPLWPILFVTIACGAISGWHSLVSSGLTSKQLEFETDARPVGGGAMITEGIVGLSSVASVIILGTFAATAVTYAQGAGKLTSSLTGISLDGMTLFYAVFVVVMGLITSMLFVRVWRNVSAELFEKSILGNKHVATIVMLLLMIFLAFTGSWTNLWIYFGGTNQLLAGLALLLVAVYLASIKRPTIYVFIPGIFMAITTVAALIWETYVYSYFLINNKPLGPQVIVSKVLGPVVVQISNGFSAVLGAVLAVLGAIMTYYLIRGYIKYRKEAVKT